MIDHPTLARDRREEEAYAEGCIAMLGIDEGGRDLRLASLMGLRRAARHDPGAAYNLACLLAGDPRRARSRPRQRMAASLHARAIALVRDRLEEPSRETGWPAREKGMRRLASMAMVNLGNIRQHTLGLAQVAHDDYLAATAMYHANEVAHLNVAQMNFGELVDAPDGDLAYRHYVQTIALGRRCRSGTPGCECLTTIVDALAAVPATERTAALPRMRRQLEDGQSALEMRPTTGIEIDKAALVEEAVDRAFHGLDADSPIEVRVTRIASLAASIADMDARIGGDVDVDAMATMRDVVDALGGSARSGVHLLMPERREPETADAAACRAMLDDQPLTDLHDGVVASLRAIASLIDETDAEAVLLHALKTAFASAAPSWRHGLLSTADNGFRQRALSGGVRVAIPGAVGRYDPLAAMRSWATDPSTMPR